VSEQAVKHYWKPGKYEPREMPADHRGIAMWGIVDTTNGGAWVEGLLDEAGNKGPLPFPTKDSATSWIRSVRYQTEANGSIR
jgi:hypothetical protein